MLVKVTYRTMHKGSAHDVWFIMDTPHRTIGAANYSVIENGVLMGRRLETELIEGTERDRRIASGKDVLMMTSALVSVEEFQGTLLDADGFVYEAAE